MPFKHQTCFLYQVLFLVLHLLTFAASLPDDMPSRVQVCDATSDAQRTEAGLQKK